MNDITTKDLPEYQSFLAKATEQIIITRVQAAQSVNKKAIQLYWWLGENIVQHQNQHGWGKSVVEHLSQDLKKLFLMQNLGFQQEICGICVVFTLKRPLRNKVITFQLQFLNICRYFFLLQFKS